MAFDYKKLLKKYIEHVGECEGYDMLSRVTPEGVGVSEEELAELRRISDNPLDPEVPLPRPPAAMSRWQHKKGGFYMVTQVTNLSCTRPGWVPTVSYMCMETGELYSRPLAEWTTDRYTPANY